MSKRSKAKKNRSTKNLFVNGLSGDEYSQKYDEMLVTKAQKRKKLIKKILLIVLCVLLALAIIVASVFAYLYYSGKGQLKNDKKPSIPANADVTNVDENTIIFKGQKYKFDENITTALCIGVDKDDETQQKTADYGKGGQADALFLLCIDNKNKKYTVLSINRDSMADVDVYYPNGDYSGIQKMQLCLSYAYGDGKKKSCKNTVKAVSRLLYNIPINSYFSINKACIPLLNDIIGGVEVPLYDNNGNLTGKTDYLEGEEAYNYIHYRDTSKLDSNLVRMKRQTSYIKAFASKAIAATKENLSTPLDMFETISLYSTTNLNASKITYLTTNAFSDRNDIKIDFKSIPGKVSKGEGGYAEFNVDNNKLLEMIIDVFYEKI